VLDLVAETFARALERRGQFDAGRGTAASWLLAIAHNLIVDAARHGKVADQSRHRLGMGPIELIDEDLERVHERDGVGETRAELQRYVSELPPEQREAVERRTPTAPPDMAPVLQAAADHGLEILGPPGIPA
jgi:RNA polymerase sigma-70 factor (ECF subfamily)